jgi:hypothetical protein
MTLLQNPHVDADKKLRRHLNEKLEFLLKQTPDEYLDELELGTLFQTLQTLLDASGKVNRSAAKALMGTPAPSAAAAAVASPPLAQSPAKHEDDLAKALKESLKTASQASDAARKVAKPPLPPLAFGALKWELYFGLQVVEPACPDIDKILASPCPFFPGKIVAQTHLLTLVPEGMTLEKLESLMLNPRQSQKIEFRHKGASMWAQYSKTSSGKAHWVLMPNDVIPNSRNKTWQDQQRVAVSYKAQGYELLSVIDGAASLLLEYVQTGRRFYPDSPLTYARCVEKVVQGSSQWTSAIGGFAPGGLIVSEGSVEAYEHSGLGLARSFF